MIRSVRILMRRFQRDERGTVAIIMGVLLVPLIGAIGIGFEVSNWYRVTRAMQNAADAAVVAAATNGGATYSAEAAAVAAQYGFVNGVSNVTITSSNSAPCPGGGNNCYSVSISGYVPLLLSEIVGFAGDAKINGLAAKRLAASSVATAGGMQSSFCLLALGPPGIRTNGAPKANMQCNVMSNTGATCNGHNLGAPIGAAHTTNNGCGVNQYSNVPAAVDPYAALASNIPPNPCGSYPQEPSKKGAPLPNNNLWSGTQSLSGNVFVCGDLQLTGDVSVNAPAGAVLVIENGQLDTNGYTFKTTNGSGLTIIFSGTNSGSYTHAPTGGGTIDVAAPTSGTWSGIAIYQDPNLTSGVNISAAGNSPTWDITGLVYLPNASVTFSGAVNKAGYGQSCFVLVVNDITINGTGMILPNGQCIPAGLLNMPTTTLPGRGILVA
ncbi:TadE/TadG family type IV pilus assembly protein [Bradyrhizobium sp. ORS 111]|uniref:TadE/TadG family type IV pilus assembly protein n=1 Tax=Bradyrhizobium sp. ORS 111 TaxID=1685958 RepID=UPI00388F834D